MANGFRLPESSRPGQKIFQKPIDIYLKCAIIELSKERKVNKMRITETTDKSYPIKLDDSWGEGVYIHRTIIEDDEKWNNFINELQDIRKKVLTNK